MNFFISFTVIWFILLQVRNKGQTSSKIISTLNGTRYRFISVTLLLPKSRYHFLSLSTAEFESLISDLILRESEEKSDMIPHSCVFLSSRHIYSWKCIDIVRRNSILVTPRSGYDHTTRTKSFALFAYVLMYLVCLGVRIWPQWKGVVSSRDASIQG